METNSIFQVVGWLFASYFLGSIPTGLLLSRLKGVDIRTVGSGNIGATNVFRSVGKSWGIATFVCDAIKGFIPAFIFPLFAQNLLSPWASALPILCAVAAILGHNFSIFLGFKGGKGVATSAGALLGMAPLAGVIGLVSWAALFFSTRYVSVASIGVAIIIPIAGWFIYAKNGNLLPGVLTALGVLIVVRHRANIQRLFNGTELRFNKRK